MVLDINYSPKALNKHNCTVWSDNHNPPKPAPAQDLPHVEIDPTHTCL